MMYCLNTAIDISRGIGDAHYNQHLREGNRNANLGMNHLFSCITHYCLLENTFSKVNEIVKKISFPTVPDLSLPVTSSIALFLSLSLTFAKKSINFTHYPTTHLILTTVENHILPNIILVTNLVASVASIIFNSPIYGSVNLSFLLLYLLHENGWMDIDFIQKNRILKGVLGACIITKAIHALLFNLSLNPYYLYILGNSVYQAVNYIKKPTDNKISSISLREYESKFSESAAIPYRLQKYHLLKNPMSNRPLEDLTHQFDQYALSLKEYLEQDLSLYHVKLIHKFRNEERWIQDYNNNPIDYLSHGINSFLRAIEISNNLEFKNKSLSIIRHILHLPNQEQIDRLADLAITGHYCPERLYSDTNLLYDTYIDTLESRALPTKVINLLQEERAQILDQILAGIHGTFLSSMVISVPNTNELLSIRQRLTNLFIQVLSSLTPPMGDIHFANCIKNILCPYLYVEHKSIDTLATLPTKDLTWTLFTWLYKKIGFIGLIESIFSHQYNPRKVLKRISDVVETEPTLSTLEIEQWFLEQYRSDYPEATQSAAVEWLRKQVYLLNDHYTPKIKPYYMLFFLINQGVLQIEDNLPLNQEPQRAIEIIHTLFPPDYSEEETPIEGL